MWCERLLPQASPEDGTGLRAPRGCWWAKCSAHALASDSPQAAAPPLSPVCLPQGRGAEPTLPRVDLRRRYPRWARQCGVAALLPAGGLYFPAQNLGYTAARGCRRAGCLVVGRAEWDLDTPKPCKQTECATGKGHRQGFMTPLRSLLDGASQTPLGLT